MGCAGCENDVFVFFAATPAASASSCNGVETELDSDELVCTIERVLRAVLRAVLCCARGRATRSFDDAQCGARTKLRRRLRRRQYCGDPPRASALAATQLRSAAHSHCSLHGARIFASVSVARDQPAPPAGYHKEHTGDRRRRRLLVARAPEQARCACESGQGAASQRSCAGARGLFFSSRVERSAAPQARAATNHNTTADPPRSAEERRATPHAWPTRTSPAPPELPPAGATSGKASAAS